MHWSDVPAIFAVLAAVFGGTFLLAGWLVLNKFDEERSKKDGRLLSDKARFGSWREQQEANFEWYSRLPEIWTKRPLAQGMVYSGLVCFVVAGLLLILADVLQ